jgi:hypothetical protein
MAQARHGDAPATSLTFSASARVLYSEVERWGVCFETNFLCWHDKCIKKLAMLKARLPEHDADFALAGRPERNH